MAFEGETDRGRIRPRASIRDYARESGLLQIVFGLEAMRVPAVESFVKSQMQTVHHQKISNKYDASDSTVPAVSKLIFAHGSELFDILDLFFVQSAT